MSDYNSSRSQSQQQGKSRFYSQSAFLRTSAVYGSGEPTPFNETTCEKFRRARGLSADDEIYHRASGQSTHNSAARQRSGTPTQSTPRTHLAGGGTMSGVRGSLLQGSPSAHGGYYETSNGQYGSSANNTPTRSRGGDSPMRARQAPSQPQQQTGGAAPPTPQRDGSNIIQRGPTQQTSGVARSAGTPVARNPLNESGSVTRRASGLSSGGVSSVAASPTNANALWSQESVLSSGTDAPHAVSRSGVSRARSPVSQQRRDVPLEATNRNTMGRNEAASSRLFGGNETLNLILNRNPESGSPQLSRTASGSQTPTRMSRRMVAPPERKEPDGLWVRTKGKNDSLVLGSRGRCAEPPSSKEAPAIPAARRIISRPDSMKGPCQVVAEDAPSRPSSRPATPRGGGSPYRGVVPPFKVDPDLMTSTLDGSRAGGERETYLEPFGTEYTHRRHFDPKDSVKEDIQHLNVAPTKSPVSTGTARVPSGRHDVNVLNLHTYTPEELNEKPRNNRYMVGPPAFVFDPPRKRLESPRRNSPSLQSSLNFGTAAAAALPSGLTTPGGSMTPRRRGSGAFTPQRSERPF